MISEKNWEFTTKTLKELMKQSDRLLKAANAVKLAPESPLVEAYAIVEDQLIKTLAWLIDDQYENLAWYAYECDYGRDPKKAGYAEAIQLIDSFDKLRWLIEVGQDVDGVKAMENSERWDVKLEL